jgi:hypothetical protein
MRTQLLSFAAVGLLGCSGAPRGPGGRPEPPTQPEPPGAGARLAGTAAVPGDAVGPAFGPDGPVLLVAGGKLLRFDPRTLAAIDARPLTTSPRPGGAAVVLHGAQGDVAIEPAAAAQIVVAPPAGYGCGEAAFSAGALRLSRNCRAPGGDGEERVVVQDAGTGAVLAELDEFHPAGPVRAGAITESGNFVFWQSRASGAFEEIKSKVTGPTTSSHSVMSPDERALFTVSDKNWMPDDRTPAQVLDPANGHVRYTLPFDIERVYFSPDGQRFAAVHVGEDRQIRSVTVHRTADGAVTATLDERAIDVIAFSADARRLALRADGVLKLYVGLP